MQKLDEPEKIANVIARYKLKPKKSLSQNFLLDFNLTTKIASSMGNLRSTDVLEIGPGPGGLTRSLLSLGARRVVVIEKDEQFLDPLKEISDSYPGRLAIIHGDALTEKPEFMCKSPIKIVSNLPYNVGTKILVNLITSETWPPFWDSLTFMFQNEVAKRLVALPKTKSYGRLSIMTQWRSEAKILFKVPSESFTPAPKVDSAVVQIIPAQKPFFSANQKVLQKVVKVAFGQRRKMLRKSLQGIHPNLKKILHNQGVDPSSRPEELTIEQFCRIAIEIEKE